LAVRIFQLAKELGKSSKELMTFLATQGHKYSNHMQNIPDTVAMILRDRYKPKTPKAPPPPARPAPGAETKAGATSPQERKDIPASGKRTVGPAGAPAAAAASKPAVRDARASGTPETEADWEKKKDVKEKEKEKEVPTRKRYFPTREDLYDSGPRFGAGRRRPGGKPQKGGRKEMGGEAAVATQERPIRVEIALPITVKDLSAATGIKGAAIIKSLMQHGHPVHINQFLDEDLVTTIALEFNLDIAPKKEADLEEPIRKLEAFESQPESLMPRAPVVTFLGHVDHGKTSLLDKIRQTTVTQREAGGITQHLGAYRVDKDKVHVVFIDTPGHQAFTEMRARGANATDVAVLVVAADDGVMPQTEEALNHAKAAKVKIVVAINKIDKPTANIMRTKQQLSSLGLQPVEWGGDIEFVEVSALTSQGIDNLLETLSLESEILELKADPKRPAVGVVLEAESSTSRGVLAMVLVQEGTLRAGDYVLCGAAHGRIRGLFLNGTVPVKEAPPATPVKITGLDQVPEAGDKFYVLEDFQVAREIAEARLRRKRERVRAERPQVTLENLFSELEKGAAPVLTLILKADVKGSIEALRKALDDLSTEEVKVRIIHAGVGAINQEDVNLATASSAIVIGFNVTADERARSAAEERKVEIRFYQVIYKVIDDVRAGLEQRLAPQREEEIHGHAEIRQVFKASKVGNIAGCMVTDGLINRSDQIRLIRDGKILLTGTIASLKRVKDDAREVKEGFECGLKIANFDDIKVSDVVEGFAIVEKKRTL
jgi:translation initiation factor IF-2